MDVMKIHENTRKCHKEKICSSTEYYGTREESLRFTVEREGAMTISSGRAFQVDLYLQEKKFFLLSRLHFSRVMFPAHEGYCLAAVHHDKHG